MGAFKQRSEVRRAACCLGFGHSGEIIQEAGLGNALLRLHLGQHRQIGFVVEAGLHKVADRRYRRATILGLGNKLLHRQQEVQVGAGFLAMLRAEGSVISLHEFLAGHGFELGHFFAGLSGGLGQLVQSGNGLVDLAQLDAVLPCLIFLGIGGGVKLVLIEGVDLLNLLLLHLVGPGCHRVGQKGKTLLHSGSAHAGRLGFVRRTAHAAIQRPVKPDAGHKAAAHAVLRQLGGHFAPPGSPGGQVVDAQHQSQAQRHNADDLQDGCKFLHPLHDTLPPSFVLWV